MNEAYEAILGELGFSKGDMEPPAEMSGKRALALMQDPACTKTLSAEQAIPRPQELLSSD